jgi:glycosyltransferase involved in cell wall biosynthesis
MNTPTFIDVSIDPPPVALAARVVDTSGVAESAARSDVLFVLSSLGVGGSECKIARMANRLKEDDVGVTLACLNGPYTLESSVRRDVPLHKLERRGKFSFSAVWRLRRLLLQARPATVIAVNLYAALYVACATALLSHRPRTVALVNTSTFRGRRLWKRMYQAVLSRFDLTVHGSQAQRRFWVDADRQAGDNSTVIYNGVDSAHFEPVVAHEEAKRLRARLGVSAQTLLMGTIGRMRPEKNQEVLLTALRHLRVARVDVHLVIAGDGPLRDFLARRAVELEVADRVSFVGELDDVRPVLTALDVFVLPSTAIESFSNAALEAMAIGRPVILSDIGGAREMIDDGVEGYVVSPTELSARLPALIAALYADQRKRQQMGQAARLRAETRFSVGAMVAAYHALLGGESA